MRSGKMRYRVQIQKPHRDDMRRGGKTVWQDVHVGPEEVDGLVWAAIRQQRAGEANPTSKQKTVIGHFEIRIWSVPDMDETWRIVHGGYVYNIVSIDDPVLTSRERVIIAKRDKLKEEANVP